MNLLDSSESGGYGVSRMHKMDTFALSLLTDYSSVEKGDGGRGAQMACWATPMGLRSPNAQQSHNCIQNTVPLVQEDKEGKM